MRKALAALACVMVGGCIGDMTEEGTLALDPLQPAYAIQIDSSITAQKAGEPAVTGTSTTQGYLLNEASGSRFWLCSLEMPPVGGRGFTIRPDVYPYIAPSSLTLLTPDEGAGGYWLAPWAILMGWRNLTDPVNEVLPTDPADPRVDRVEPNDNGPGVQLGIQVTGWVDPQVDISVRVRLSDAMLFPQADGSLVGDVSLAHDVWVWFADMPWPMRNRGAEEANRYVASKRLEYPIVAQHHRITARPISEALLRSKGCDAIVTE